MARLRDIDDPRRRMLVQALALGLLCGGGTLVTRAQGPLGSRPSRLPEGRSVYRVRGDVTVNGAPANARTRIQAGDTVKTGGGSELIFALGGSAMIVRSRTTLTIEGGDGSLLARGLRVLTGALLSVSRSQPIQVKTSTASIGIRGTGFYVESEPDKTYFCTCYGRTDIVSSADPESRAFVEASHHDRPVYILAGEPRGRNIRNAPFINHTDQELALIEALVGRSPPFVFPKESYGGPRRDY